MTDRATLIEINLFLRSKLFIPPKFQWISFRIDKVLKNLFSTFQINFFKVRDPVMNIIIYNLSMAMASTISSQFFLLIGLKKNFIKVVILTRKVFDHYSDKITK